ncbi:MAG: hypothetical protein WCJ61_17825, partial [Paludibacter sp.]
YTTVNLAIAASTSASDVITISAGTVTEKVLLTKSLTIKGAGMGSTILQPLATPISASGNVAFSLTTNGNTITLQDMTIQNGFNAASGGGVRVIGSGTTSTLNLTNLKISNNKATKGGGVYIQGPVVLIGTSCNITGNTATDIGPNTTGGGGIAINPQTTFAANVTIKNSTISNNGVAATAKNNGGGISVQCGSTASGISNSLWIENSTIYGNSTGYAGKSGGGIYFMTAPTGQAVAPTQTVTLNHCTIANNTTNAGTGGDGVCIDDAGGYTTTLVMNNTIVMNNSGSTSNQSQVGTNVASQAKITDGGVTNIITGIITGGLWVTATPSNNNIIDGTGNLAFASGLSSDVTPVLLIGSASIAKDYVVTNSLVPALATDQLGNARVGLTDAGAYEYQPVSYTVAASAGANGVITSGTGIYENGATATLVATSSVGYGFLNWTEGATVVSTLATYPFTVSRAVSLVANFVTHSLVSASPADLNGTVSATSTYVNDGASFTLTATPSVGYGFLN